MELNELKKTWQEAKPVQYSRKELDSIFEIKTRRSLKSINRSMLTDAVFMVLVTAGFVSITFILGLKSRYIISGELLFIAILLCLHYRIKHLTLSRINLSENNITEAILQIIKKVKGYLLLYKVLTPLIAGGLFILYQVNTNFYNTGIYSLPRPAFTIGIALSTGILVLALTHFITTTMYGKELKRLKQMYKDLAHGKNY
ncbi:hypothetical protein JMN32_24620 [Fulvivirga sp. 29W222]|uniref:Uncharacterized protein n=1 Tax=Fulvivirga marina TaxID=2494733 RepID=A0A937G0N1_9BACT|nr:hypothetical protein [Fulvivirga marina]MBL6449519.1 hypothetical protein [Fulvivirga marina]